MAFDKQTIQDFLLYLWTEENKLDDKYHLDKAKDILLKEFRDSPSIQKRLIAPIEREFDSLNLSYLSKVQASDKNISRVVGYMQFVLAAESHYFKPFLTEAIEEKISFSGWGDNLDEIFLINALLTSSLQKLTLIELFEEDEKQLLVKKRDREKIDKAIDLLKISFPEDAHLNHSLDTLKFTNEHISDTFIYSSFFYHYTKSILEATRVSKSKSTTLANELLFYIFDAPKDYRIYKNSKTLNYKGLKLTAYKK